MARSSKKEINLSNLENEIYQKIDKTSEIFGINDKEKTIFEILQVSNVNEKKLVLKSGSWESMEPWFGIDENGEIHTMISIKSLLDIVKTCKKVMKENFDLKLEKSILQKMPIDFNDVLAVCMDEIRKIGDKKQISYVSLNLDNVVEKVKKEHPNLFVDLNELMESF